PVLVTARVEVGEEAVKLLASTAEPISEVRERSVREIHIEVERDALTQERVLALRALLEKERGDRPTRLVVRAEGSFTASFSLGALPTRPTQDLVDGARALFGDAVAVVM